jgi:hypothetical protein
LLPPFHDQIAAVEVDLIAPQVDQFRHPQPVAVGDADDQLIPEPVAADAGRGLGELLDLGFRQVFPAAAFLVGAADRRRRPGRLGLGPRLGHGLRLGLGFRLGGHGDFPENGGRGRAGLGRPALCGPLFARD